MTTLTVDIPESAFSAMRQAPDESTAKMVTAAAAKWQEIGGISQGRAAEIAGLSRAASMAALSRYRVSR